MPERHPISAATCAIGRSAQRATRRRRPSTDSGALRCVTIGPLEMAESGRQARRLHYRSGAVTPNTTTKTVEITSLSSPCDLRMRMTVQPSRLNMYRHNARPRRRLSGCRAQCPAAHRSMCGFRRPTAYLRAVKPVFPNGRWPCGCSAPVSRRHRQLAPQSHQKFQNHHSVSPARYVSAGRPWSMLSGQNA